MTKHAETVDMRSIMQTSFISIPTVILLSLVLACSARAQAPAKPANGESAPSASTSAKPTTAPAEPVDLGAVLRTTSALVLPIEALRSLNGHASWSLTLVEGKSFRTDWSGGRGCGGELKITGNSASGACIYKFDSPSLGCGEPQSGKLCPPQTFSFTITGRSSSNGKLVYDLPKACLGNFCTFDDDLCIQTGKAPREDRQFEIYDCTPRPIFPPLKKATPKALAASLADIKRQNLTMTFTSHDDLDLMADGTFTFAHLLNDEFACWGKWSHGSGLRLNGSCMDRPQLQKTGGHFNLDVEMLSVGGMIVSGEICTSRTAKCQKKKTFRWFRQHGIRDIPWEPEYSIQIIPGAENRTLFSTVTSLLRTKYKEDYPLRRMPVLLEGVPAKSARMATEIYFGAGGEAMAEALAAMLEPVVGTVALQPWPGETEHQAVVVVGEKVASP